MLNEPSDILSNKSISLQLTTPSDIPSNCLSLDLSISQSDRPLILSRTPSYVLSNNKDIYTIFPLVSVVEDVLGGEERIVLENRIL